MKSYVQGYYTPVNPEKYVGQKKPIYRSSWEFKLMQAFDTNPSFINWGSECLKIPYLNPFTNKYSVYIPDFLVMYEDAKGQKKVEIIEVKPRKETYLEEAKNERNRAAVALNAFKWKAAQEFASRNGMTFRVMTEDNIFNNPGGQKKRRR